MMKQIDGLPKKLPQENRQPLKIPQNNEQLATTKAQDLAAQIKSFFTPKKDLDTLQAQKIKKQRITFKTKKLPTKKPLKIISRQTRKTLAYFRKIILRLTVIVVLAMLILVQALSETNLGQKAALLALLKDGKYLVVLQNNRELRPTGGFMGSFVTVEIKNLKLQNWYFETNIYERDREFFKLHNIPQPEALNRFWPNRTGDLANSNWRCDFTQAAPEIEWFYKEYYNNDIDGIIALNATAITDLLKLTGPINIGSPNTTLDADNFLDVVQYLIEKEYWLKPENLIINEPKTVLKETFPILVAKLQNLPKEQVLVFIQEKLNQKEIQLFAKNFEAQKIILAQNWGGKIREDWSGDYLYLCQANVGGGKSSLNIFDKLDYRVGKNAEGKLQTKLIINREHHGTGEWPSAKNYTYVRLLVPKGSQFVSLDTDSEIKKMDEFLEAGKTAFGFWLDTAPGEKSDAEIEYLLPEKIKLDDYKLLVQKQSGTNPFDLTVLIDQKEIFKDSIEKDTEIVN